MDVCEFEATLWVLDKPGLHRENLSDEKKKGGARLGYNL